jgi:trimethylamine--corrinoid protein Co-methyltransferase
MTDDAAARIHEAALDLLDDPGVRIEHDELLGRLLSHGAKEGREAAVARIPREMVEECLAACPKSVVLAGRKDRRSVLTCRSEPVFWSAPGMNLYRNGENRPFTSSDMADMARLLDQLSEVQTVFGMALHDIPPPARDVVGLRVMAENTSKHIRVLCFSPRSMDVMAEMKDIVGPEPWFSIGFTAHGPLRWTRLALEIFRRTAGRGIPTTVNGEPMAGTSGPVTLAGSAAVGNAEILAGIVVNQVLEPGRPCIYNLGLAHVFDMKTAIAVTGGPENALFASLSALMGRFYGLPSASWVSTEAMCPDSQAALEKMFGFHTHLEERVSAIWGVGQLESEMTLSPAQAVMDNEMIQFARRHRQGFEVTPDSLAVEVTRSVGIAGSFLGHDHTLRNYRRELFEPAVLFRKRRAQWDKDGRKRLDQRAEELASELMSRPADPGLSQDQLSALDAVVGRYLKELGQCAGG